MANGDLGTNIPINFFIFKIKLILYFRIPPGLEFTQLCTVLESGKISTNWTHKLSFWSLEDQVRAMPCAADKTILIRYERRMIIFDS